MMLPKSRTGNGGCWTCKIRRKKCDELRPTCKNCDNLNIGCDYGSKPSWMDGGDRQRRKAATLKNEIKRKAAHKREKGHIPDKASASTAKHRFDIISDMTVQESLTDGQPTATRKPDASTPTPRSNITTNYEPTLISSLPWGCQEHQRSDTLEGASASEMNFIMKYLDFVFPALFPFHQSHLFETGRSWLLLLLRKRRIAYHATLSLSCYYFTLALTDAEDGAEHKTCKQLRWEEVERETEKCFENLRTEVLALNLNSRGMSATMLERVELVNSITHFVLFEMAVGKFSPYNTHLSAAITLLEEILVSSETRLMYRDQPQSKFASVLLGIGEPLWTNPGPSNHIWSPDQAGFRFCAGLLIFIDAIASTTTQETPRLLRYYSTVLSKLDDGMPAVGEAEIRLSSIVGCRNGVVRSIGNTSAWRRSRHEPSHLVRLEVRESSSRVANDLDDTILSSQNSLTTSVTLCADEHTQFDRSSFSLGPTLPSFTVPSLIWGLGARLYLSVSLDGWQLANPKVRADVAQMIELLESVPLDQLRTLAWPICTAGCLALPEEELFFAALVSKLSKVQMTGALNDAREIMEKVWQNRSTQAIESLDFASCFAIVGSPILLV
ncbi:hypothetical protein M3J09_009657 [Ascochyta lentis]